jgi:hypothetical protein
MMDRDRKYDPFGLITDITGDGWQLGPGTYLFATQSQQSFIDTLGGAFGTITTRRWLGHSIKNIEDDGDSTDNYPARWDTYDSFFNDTAAPGASHKYKFTVPAGETRKYYLFADGSNRLVYGFTDAKIVIEIIKIGG